MFTYHLEAKPGAEQELKQAEEARMEKQTAAPLAKWQIFPCREFQRNGGFHKGQYPKIDDLDMFRINNHIKMDDEEVIPFQETSQ